MSDTYGERIGSALRAVETLHSDCSRLLQDCDGTIGEGRDSVFGSWATDDLTYNVRARRWMAEGVFRYYDAKTEMPGLVEGIMIAFLGPLERSKEPVIIVGQIQYRGDEGIEGKAACKKWDLWYSFFKWSNQQPFREVYVSRDDDKGRIEWLKAIAVPLYSIKSMQSVVELMERVRRHTISES